MNVMPVDGSSAVSRGDCVGVTFKGELGHYDRLR